MLHSSNQKRHILIGAYTLYLIFIFYWYAVLDLSGKKNMVWSEISSYNLINRCISAVLYLFFLLSFVIVPPLLDNGGFMARWRSPHRQSEPAVCQQNWHGLMSYDRHHVWITPAVLLSCLPFPHFPCTYIQHLWQWRYSVVCPAPAQSSFLIFVWMKSDY